MDAVGLLVLIPRLQYDNNLQVLSWVVLNHIMELYGNDTELVKIRDALS